MNKRILVSSLLVCATIWLMLLIGRTQLFQFTPFLKPSDFLSIGWGCELINRDGKTVKQYPHTFCQYLPNGRMLALDQKFNSDSESTISLFEKDGSIVWQIHRFAHHIFHLNLDRTRILTLGSVEKMYEGRLTRADSLLIIDMDGKLLQEWNLFDSLAEIEDRTGEHKVFLENNMSSYYRAKREVSHVNSIYEIPKNDLALINPAFSAGNYIVNLYLPLMRFIVLSSDFKKILWISKNRYNAHDVQVLPSGEILFYQNSSASNATVSDLVKLNPITEEVTWSFGQQERFFSEIHGNIQFLSKDVFLYTDVKNKLPRAFVKNLRGETLWSFIPSTSKNTEGFAVASYVNLEGFLSNSKM